jgi:hypothetical protein
MVVFVLPRSTRLCVSETLLVRLCDRTLLTAFVFAFALPLVFRVPAFALHGSLPTAGAATIYASSSALMKQNTHSRLREVDRPISVQALVILLPGLRASPDKSTAHCRITSPLSCRDGETRHSRFPHGP